MGAMASNSNENETNIGDVDSSGDDEDGMDGAAQPPLRVPWICL